MSWEPVVEAIEQAQAAGAWAHVLDGRELADSTEVIDAIARLLAFPETFGRNLDALYDCLTDLSWLDEGEHRLVWVDPASLADRAPADFSRVRRAVLDAAERGESGGRRLSVVFVEV
ncbi:RNAse (barnase) inhibitor barstar [Actinoalloteichus hoggarensis]|uniref:Barstar (Barnase inhibitor) n=1 Tax=Actinoalloteichus hoggarensis TaxID=1470176 RepID=A0A221W804_9PSEU|nr:barstar family protein [Actinoalloteichus hoggarensis]ASO22130.1 Barstar (barnase inhibitor) [Actinoalloteichus hoggarensis]MBB5923789.1 RNAse (barnase) inhibitor barstar [Actinoalloteichus hoggarensis]